MYTRDGPKFTRNIKNEWYPDPALLHTHQTETGLLHTGSFEAEV